MSAPDRRPLPGRRVSPGLRVEIPVENQASKPVLCAGIESEFECPPNGVANLSLKKKKTKQKNKVKAVADRVKVFNHGREV